MAAPALRGVTVPVISSGAISSPASTCGGDLMVFVVWSQAGAGIPTHTVQSGFFEWISHGHNDGSTDGCLSVAVKKAAVPGANSYTPYAISGATADQTSIGVYVIKVDTFLATLDSSLTGLGQASITLTTTSAPNPPSVADLTGDYLMLAIAAWHVTTGATTDATAPTNYVMQAENDAASHVTHLAIADRSLSGLIAATEDPGAFGDNVTPNGTCSITLAIPASPSFPPVRRSDINPDISSGAVTSPASTAVGDLMVFVVWSQGDSLIPTHTIESGFFEWISQFHNDGTFDGRLSVAVKKATVAGANSYTPYVIADATVDQTSIGMYVVRVGTYLASLDYSLIGLVSGGFSGTGTNTPNPPQVDNLTGDYLMVVIGSWHVTVATSITATDPADYVIRAQNPATSHVAHVAIADRTLAGLVGESVNPNAFGDSITPNGTVAITLAIPGLYRPIDPFGARGGMFGA